MSKTGAEKISITLPAEMLALIRAKVASGHYGSTSEVIREAMRGWVAHETLIDQGIRRGLADVEAGRYHTIDEAREIIMARLDKAFPET